MCPYLPLLTLKKLGSNSRSSSSKPLLLKDKGYWVFIPAFSVIDPTSLIALLNWSGNCCSLSLQSRFWINFWTVLNLVYNTFYCKAFLSRNLEVSLWRCSFHLVVGSWWTQRRDGGKLPAAHEWRVLRCRMWPEVIPSIGLQNATDTISAIASAKEIVKSFFSFLRGINLESVIYFNLGFLKRFRKFGIKMALGTIFFRFRKLLNSKSQK